MSVSVGTDVGGADGQARGAAGPGPPGRQGAGGARAADLGVLELLAPWRTAGVLSAGDVHLAATLCRLTGVGTETPEVVVAAALAARAPRLGHTCLDLVTTAASAAAEVEADRGALEVSGVDALPWPTDLAAWQAALAASPLVEVLVDGEPPETASTPPRPMALHGSRLYLERYLAYERLVAGELRRRAAAPPVASVLTDTRRVELLQTLVPLAPGEAAADSPQWSAATAGASRRLSVIVGGPGTGKTQTVAALLALLRAGDPSGRLRIALAAPTGKAAARMGEAFHAVAGELRRSSLFDVDTLADELDDARATTLHALLGARPGTVRMRHHADNPLAEDVVIVDETSMVSLPLMARLLDAVRPDARVVLVGDPGQLASVEAGSVLGDIAGPAVEAALGTAPPPAGPLATCVSVLTRSFRFPPGSAIDRFARAVRAGDAALALELLSDAGGAATEDPVAEGPAAEGPNAGERSSGLSGHEDAGFGRSASPVCDEETGATGAAFSEEPAGEGAPSEAAGPSTSVGQSASERTPTAHPSDAEAAQLTLALDDAVAVAVAVAVSGSGDDAVDAHGGSGRPPPTGRAGGPGVSDADGESPSATSTRQARGLAAGVRLAWIAAPGDTSDARAPVVAEVGAAAERVRDLAERGATDDALEALTALRVLCAHRRGPFGVTGWNRLVEEALARTKPLAPGFYVGRPVLVTATDRANGLFNGDLGVVVGAPGGARVAFPGPEVPRLLAPVRLESVETVHAMTIHKSQGSEFDHVVVVLPPPTSRLATRELLYTAVTRARRVVTLVGDAASVERAVTQRVVRASGLTDRLWGAA